MLDKYQNIKDGFDKGEKKFSSELNKFSDAVDEIKEHSSTTIEDIKNANIIISDIDKHFAEKTRITNIKDMTFLWSAIAIQCVRWILIPTFDIKTLTPNTENRKDSGSEGRKDKTKSGSELDKSKEECKDQEFPDSKNILAFPVPFDAMKGTEDIIIPGVTAFGQQINGRNHHSATLGHDPLIGQVVGTANIMTRSITFHDLFATTRKVERFNGRIQSVVKEPPYSKILMMKDVVASSREDASRITAALMKENLHLQSDKYTKMGLPIPFLSPALQQKLLNKNWNSKALEDVIKGSIKGIVNNFAVALVINTIVGTLHGFCYNEEKDGDTTLYSVRTRKVVATSNVIAECINLGTVLTGSIGGVLSANSELVKKSISHLDVGGMIEAIHQIVRSKKLQEKIRREFLEQELFKHFTDNKYSFLEESYYE